MTRLATIAALLLVAACETTSLPDILTFARAPEAAEDTPGTTIDTLPSDALLTYPHGTCRTPCRIVYPNAVEIKLAKEGYAPVILSVPVGAADTVFELTPVGRTVAVEETALPDL